MARIKKYAETLTDNLTGFQTYIVDTNPNSTYFRITEFKDTFTGGKNGFLIEGSEHLKESTEIKIEILDVDGNAIYWEPGNGVPEYYEGISKVIAVYLYEDTPIGEAKITILGELKTYIDNDGVTQNIPDEWKNLYNLKWEKTFKANRLLSNEDKVRFYKRPTVSITEIVKPIYATSFGKITQKGLVSGTAVTPSQGQKLTGYTLPTYYKLTTTDNSAWTGSVAGNNIEIKDLNFVSVVNEVINKNELLVTTPYTENGLVTEFTNQGYTASFNYLEGVSNIASALTGSFAKITIADLTTFVGDVARAKVFRKSQSDVTDYQFVQEIVLESNELLVDYETTSAKTLENYGIFTDPIIKSYWVTSSNSLTATFNQDYLYDSVKLMGTNSPLYFHTSHSLSLTENAEYTLDFNIRLASNISSDNYVRAFISGSTQSSVNGITKVTQVEQTITKISSQNSLLQKSTSTNNIKSQQIDNAKLYFEVKGAGWYLANVSFKASQETAFSPDEITFIEPVPRSLESETFDYRFEFYDINNNYIPVTVEQTKTFTGGNLQRITKRLQLNPSQLYFQFDSGSNPVPPTAIAFNIQKTLLTGSVHFTSQSIDFFGNILSSSQYDNQGSRQAYPGLLDNITGSVPYMTVEHFTGSNDDVIVQYVALTGECEGITDTVVITRVLDGFGGVNHIIRTFDGTGIRNSSTQSLEIQAVRIDGINDVLLNKSSRPGRGWNLNQLHVISSSLDGTTVKQKYINLTAASQSGFIKGLYTGSRGVGELDFNPVFTRDSIDKEITVYLMPSSSNPHSSSILTSIVLSDFQDGLDSGIVKYNTDAFTINFRNSLTFNPTFAYATASFYKRGSNTETVTSSFQVYPSMSINKDFVPEYWLYFTTQSCDPTIGVVARDDNKNIISSLPLNSYVGSSLQQSKNLTLTFTYTEPYTSASSNVDKTFTIVPEGKPGDESIVFEVQPANISVKSDSRGTVTDYAPTAVDIRLKQGSRYLKFQSVREAGTFYIAQASITSSNILPGNVNFTPGYTDSLRVSAASKLTDLSGSITFPMEIQPYYTSSVYTASVVQNITKVLDGPPPIEIVISPISVNLKADEVGYVTPTGYSPANTTIQVKEGADFLTFTTQSTSPGTWRINLVETKNAQGVYNIRTGSLASASLSTATLNFNRFDYPYVSASAAYTIQVYPYALGAGHKYTSSIFTRNQSFTKNVAPDNARSVNLAATYQTVNFDRDGVSVTPGPDTAITLTATPFNTTGSVWYEFFKDDNETSETGIIPDNFYDVVPGDATTPGENATWTVKIRDGNSSPTAPIRAQGSLTISGIKAGADAYTENMTNETAAITADIWSTTLTGTGTRINTFKGLDELTNKPSGFGTQTLNQFGDPIGSLGESRIQIVYKSGHIGIAGGLGVGDFVTGTPASLGDLTSWTNPATNQTATIVYEIDFENGREFHYKTQSFAVQQTATPPYDVTLSNENSSAVYKVSGQLTLSNTGTTIRGFRGNTELTHKPAGFVSPQTDMFGNTGYKDQYKVSISYVSPHLTLNGGLTTNSVLSGNPASIGNVSGWTSPEINQTAQIVYKIELEGRETRYKTQSLSIQYEGNTGPGVIMRGEWRSNEDYIGSVETTNYRRDAVIYGTNPTTYYAAVSGSGPNTYNKSSNLVGAHAPTGTTTDNAWWQYLGTQDFFVAAKIAIFDDSFVKNTLNVGLKSDSDKFANIVLAGGRTDPYIALGQVGTVGTSGNAGTTVTTAGVIGYDRPGIFMGIYENGASGTSGRFSIKNSAGNRYLRWNGSDLEVAGSITVTGGDAATQTYAQTQANAALTSAKSYADVVSTTAYTDAKAIADKIANGTYSGGTLISGTSIVSPVIAGGAGYISQTFTVGQSPNAIVLDGLSKKIYLGAGNFNSSDTGFYVDYNSNFSLGNKLVWNGTTLTIDGSANIGGSTASVVAAGAASGATAAQPGANVSVFTNNSGYQNNAAAKTAGSVGGWQINATNITSNNGRTIFFNTGYIELRDIDGNTKLTMDSSTTLPDPYTGAQIINITTNSIGPTTATYTAGTMSGTYSQSDVTSSPFNYFTFNVEASFTVPITGVYQFRTTFPTNSNRYMTITSAGNGNPIHQMRAYLYNTSTGPWTLIDIISGAENGAGQLEDCAFAFYNTTLTSGTPILLQFQHSIYNLGSTSIVTGGGYIPSTTVQAIRNVAKTAINQEGFQIIQDSDRYLTVKPFTLEFNPAFNSLAKAKMIGIQSGPLLLYNAVEREWMNSSQNSYIASRGFFPFANRASGGHVVTSYFYGGYNRAFQLLRAYAWFAPSSAGSSWSNAADYSYNVEDITYIGSNQFYVQFVEEIGDSNLPNAFYTVFLGVRELPGGSTPISEYRIGQPYAYPTKQFGDGFVLTLDVLHAGQASFQVIH